MKPIYILILAILPGLQAFAQQTTNPDDALLLDYYQNQRFADAVDYLKKIYPEPVTDQKVLSRLAYTSQMAGKLSDAEGYYQRIYDKDSTNMAILYNMASINQNRGNVNKAEIYYLRIIKRDTTDFSVYKQLAAISHSKPDMPAEIMYLQKANSLNPLDFDVASDLSDIYVGLQQFQQAETVLSKAITGDPENVILLQSLLKLAYAQKRWVMVVKTGEQLLQLGNTSQRLKLGIAYYNTKNYLCGLETLMAIPEELQNESSCYFIAACYKQMKNNTTAIFYFKKAIKLSLSESTTTYYSEMADSYQILNQNKTAETSYKKGLLYSDQPMTFYALAILYDTKLNNKKNALLYYNKYLATKPDKSDDKQYIDYSKSRIAALSAH